VETGLFVGALVTSVIAVNALVWVIVFKLRDNSKAPSDPRMREILKLIRDFERNKGTLLEIHEVNPDDVFLRKRGGL
jgi:hypothetical protein